MHRSAGVAMAWNVFRFCTALRGLGSIMILLVLAIVGVTYYAVVLCTYGPALLAGGGATLAALAVLLLFHFLLGMLLWSYFSVVFTNPGSVPPNWNLDFDEERGETAPLSGSEQQSMAHGDTGNPRVRYCRKCNQLKPPRCHHCSVCGRCILKMDHHCVWVVNCVGALNYKYFLLFLSISLVRHGGSHKPLYKQAHQCVYYLIGVFSGVDCINSTRTASAFYTFLETTLVTLSLLPHFIAFFSDVDIPGSPAALATTFLTFVLNLAFSLSVLGFMIMHVSLVSANTTTIEAYEKKTSPRWMYDLGRKKNFAQVFGNDKKYWFIPAYSEEDLRRMPALQGLDYPVRSDLDGQEL